MAGGYYFVLTRGRWAQAVPESDFDRVREMEGDGWQVIWDSARSLDEAYGYAASVARCLREDYTDGYAPRPMEAAIPLFRSVSLSELEDISVQGVVRGKGNVFNEFDGRRFVFFGSRITDRLVYQGEELERQALAALDREPVALEFEVRNKERSKLVADFSSAYDALLAEGRPMRAWVERERLEAMMKGGSAWAAGQLSKAFVRDEGRLHEIAKGLSAVDARMGELRDAYAAVAREWMLREKELRGHLPFTSAVIETRPIGHGYHYSGAHGESGFGDEDEFGFHPGSVAADDLVRIHLVKDRRVVRVVPAASLAEVVEESSEARMAADRTVAPSM